MTNSQGTRILLLTGPPGIGKTTVVRKMAEAVATRRVGGFYTEEIRVSGERKGFRLVTYGGDEAVMSHVDFDRRFRVGKYGVDIAAIDRFADSALAGDLDVECWLVDEIGKMECLSRRFVSRMTQVLASGKPVIATVAQFGGGMIEAAKRRPDSELWGLTRSNRDELARNAIRWLVERLGRDE